MMFIVLSVILLLIVIAILAIPFWRQHQPTINSNTSNLKIFKLQVQELNQDLADGKINQQQHKTAQLDLERSLGFSLTDTNTNSPTTSTPILGAILTIFLIVTISTGSYFLVGNFNQPVTTSQPSVAELINLLKPRVAQAPKVNELIMLAQLYKQNNQFELAVKMYRQADKLKPNSANTILQLAYAIALSHNASFIGEPEKLLKLVLTLEPENQDAAYLLGQHQFRTGNFQAAIDYWQQLLPALNPIDAAEVQKDIDFANSKLGIATKPASKLVIKPKRQIKVKVSISTTINANSRHTVFVSAHTKDGPPMPLAAVKLTVADLPITINLDATKAIIPNMTIDKFNNIFIKARISSSGNATIQVDDIWSVVAVSNDDIDNTNKIHNLVIQAK